MSDKSDDLMKLRESVITLFLDNMETDGKVAKKEVIRRTIELVRSALREEDPEVSLSLIKDIISKKSKNNLSLIDKYVLRFADSIKIENLSVAYVDENEVEIEPEQYSTIDLYGIFSVNLHELQYTYEVDNIFALLIEEGKSITSCNLPQFRMYKHPKKSKVAATEGSIVINDVIIVHVTQINPGSNKVILTSRIDLLVKIPTAKDYMKLVSTDYMYHCIAETGLRNDVFKAINGVTLVNKDDQFWYKLIVPTDHNIFERSSSPINEIRLHIDHLYLRREGEEAGEHTLVKKQIIPSVQQLSARYFGTTEKSHGDVKKWTSKNMTQYNKGERPMIILDHITAYYTAERYEVDVYAVNYNIGTKIYSLQRLSKLAEKKHLLYLVSPNPDKPYIINRNKFHLLPLLIRDDSVESLHRRGRAIADIPSYPLCSFFGWSGRFREFWEEIKVLPAISRHHNADPDPMVAVSELFDFDYEEMVEEMNIVINKGEIDTRIHIRYIEEILQINLIILDEVKRQGVSAYKFEIPRYSYVPTRVFNAERTFVVMFKNGGMYSLANPIRNDINDNDLAAYITQEYLCSVQHYSLSTTSLSSPLLSSSDFVNVQTLGINHDGKICMVNEEPYNRVSSPSSVNADGGKITIFRVKNIERIGNTPLLFKILISTLAAYAVARKEGIKELINCVEEYINIISKYDIIGKNIIMKKTPLWPSIGKGEVMITETHFSDFVSAIFEEIPPISDPDNLVKYIIENFNSIPRLETLLYSYDRAIISGYLSEKDGSYDYFTSKSNAYHNRLSWAGIPILRTTHINEIESLDKFQYHAETGATVYGHRILDASYALSYIEDLTDLHYNEDMGSLKSNPIDLTIYSGSDEVAEFGRDMTSDFAILKAGKSTFVLFYIRGDQMSDQEIDEITE